ncbi:Uncharacterized conserved protein, DUF58 family, contains vWF domain [Roseateles sp. YR242]|uniref:DUF58 domain-containing protein n=1 Tax=Roseateles sp. YR242 TaxID=1855305 RepID=UPI0008BEC604|nr:DUF58 domain-containing protein [Roseateles sp. YR242]SEK62371.1 Uncharacterized conserved protein, DUF58 family, contains vWF domain [Roseateles sp. YR242]
MNTASRVILPTRASIGVLVAVGLAFTAALSVGAPLGVAAPVGLGLLATLLLAAAVDLWRSLRLWARDGVRVERHLPAALAIGAPTELKLDLVNAGPLTWQLQVFDELDPLLDFEGLPRTLSVAAQTRSAVNIRVTARERGVVQLGRTQLLWRTRGGIFEVRKTVGEAHKLRVYPNFAALARYAWLSGDRRLAQIGIKDFVQRGQGTDFRQLAEYRRGDPLRHLDVKASLRHRKPVVREYQDERDQCVMFLLDCGRRMRADEQSDGQRGASHFDDALDAMMLLAYVALSEGDEVGAMTFGCEAGQRRDCAPRKGMATLNALMNRMHDLQPGGHHSDYLAAAEDMSRRLRRRSLIIVLTNFRDEDSPELQPALRLLRRRHLVLLASLRETALGSIATQPITTTEDAVAVASAHLLSQARQDAFARVVDHDRLSIDVEPRALAATLVNRYHQVKRSGLL